MKDWTKREWLEALGYVVAGLILARLFPDIWENIVVPLGIVAFVWMMVRHRRREDRREQEEQAMREKERWRGWGESGQG